MASDLTGKCQWFRLCRYCFMPCTVFFYCTNFISKIDAYKNAMELFSLNEFLLQSDLDSKTMLSDQKTLRMYRNGAKFTFQKTQVYVYHYISHFNKMCTSEQEVLCHSIFLKCTVKWVMPKPNKCLIVSNGQKLKYLFKYFHIFGK